MVKAVIFGCSGDVLTDEEKSFFERTQPLGFILFDRNCQTPYQLKKLVQDLKESVGRDDVKILIDQEGGRISRLNRLYWRVPPKAQDFGELYEMHPEEAYQAVYNNALLMSYDLQSMGINVNCAPLADLPSSGSHPIIGDRAFSPYLETTVALCLSMIHGLQDMGITPVLKHFPGHGRASVDSHEQLPVVSASKKELFETDFECFKQILMSLNHTLRPMPWGMTAHIVYDAIDGKNPATFSHEVIDSIIRGHLDFQGFLVSDCLTMKALKGSMGERAERALYAGCDAVLHCNGDFAEMVDVASCAPELDDVSITLLEDSIPKKTYGAVEPEILEASIQKAFSQNNRPDKAKTM